MIARYLNTDGAAGYIPAWYRLVKAAQYLRVKPWELAEKPFYWIARAEAAADAEERHREYKNSSRRRSR
jgi:hypothetical protein